MQDSVGDNIITSTNNISNTALSPNTPANKVTTRIPRSNGVLVVDHELCSGCMQCVHTCSLVKFGLGSHELSGIKMAAVNKYVFDAYAQPCLQCVKPKCLLSCPTEAIIVDKVTGSRVINEKLCTGCQICIDACPYKPPRISFDKVRNKAIKCDLCGGDPACVKACPTGALHYRIKTNRAQS